MTENSQQNNPQKPKFPNIVIKFDRRGWSGNAFAILAQCKIAMKKDNIPDYIWQQFLKESTSGEYEDFLNVLYRWFTVEELLHGDVT